MLGIRTWARKMVGSDHYCFILVMIKNYEFVKILTVDYTRF